VLDQLAKLLGLSRTDAEASMHSERAARHVLSRRSAIGLGAAMCARTVFGDAIPLVSDAGAFHRAVIAEIDRTYVSFFEHMKRIYPADIIATPVYDERWRHIIRGPAK
jgi:hypothetical protein